MPKTFNGDDVVGAPTVDGVTGDSLGDHNGTIQHGYDYANPLFSSDLELFCPFDDDSGDATDYSANANHGTVNGAAYNDEQFLSTGVFSLDGDNDVISFPSGILNGADAGTFLVWTNVSQAPSNPNLYALLTKAVDPDTVPKINLYIESGGRYRGVVHFGSAAVLDATTVVSDGDWHMGAMRWDKNTGSAEIFTDAVEEESEPLGGSQTLSNEAMKFGNVGGRSYYYQGGAALAVVASRALSNSEIQQFYDIGPTGSLVSGWK